MENLELRNELSKFLAETSNIFKTVDPRLSTNRKESFHAEAAKFAPKRFSWCGSYEGRMRLAVCSHNDPLTWKDSLRRRVHADALSPEVQLQARPNDEIESAKKNLRSTTDYKKKESARRKSSRDANKGDYGQKWLP